MDLNNCSLPDSFWIAASWARFTRLKIVLPIYLIAGLGGHLIFSIAIYKEIKKDNSYRYQLFGAITGIIEIFSFTGYIFSRLCSGVTGSGYDWWMTNPALMWYSAHLAIPFSNMANTTSLLLAVSTAADRVFILILPLRYRNINKKRHQLIALIACVFIGIFSSLYQCFLYQLDSKFIISTNKNFVTSILWTIMDQLSNIIKIICLIALISCNVIIVIQYRKRFRKVAAPAANTAGDKKEEKRKKFEQILILLTMCESIFLSLSTSSSVAFFMAVALMPRFNDCQAFLFGPSQDMVIMLALILDFYAALIISKQFREMAMKILPKLRLNDHSG